MLLFNIRTQLFYHIPDWLHLYDLFYAVYIFAPNGRTTKKAKSTEKTPSAFRFAIHWQAARLQVEVANVSYMLNCY